MSGSLDSSVIFVLVEHEFVVGELFPVGRHAVDFARPFFIPGRWVSKGIAHLVGVRAVLGAEMIAIESRLHTLGLVDETKAGRVSIGPFVELVPTTTHSDLVVASVFLF